MATFKIEKRHYRDEHNALCAIKIAVIDGTRHAIQPTGHVWGPKEWRTPGKAGSVVKYSRLNPVFEYNGERFRVFDRVAKPLRLEPGESFHDIGFAPGKAFV